MINDIVIATAQIHYDDPSITQETKLEDLNGDEFDFINLVMAIEQDFNIDLPDPKLGKVESMADLIKLVEGETK